MTDTILAGFQSYAPGSVFEGSGTRTESAMQTSGKDVRDRRKQELQNASREFESMFIAYMLKVMRETINESGLSSGGFGKSIYTDMFDQEVARSLASRSMLGISDLLYRNLQDTVLGDEPENPDDPGRDLKSTPPAVDPATNGDLENSEINMRIPVSAPVSSAFGIRKDPFTRELKFHKGLDIAAPEGTPVATAMPGRVTAAGHEKGYGNYVIVQHSDALQTLYGHLGKIHVKSGDTVSEEELIGTVGSTGHSTGPHLHFEVLRMGKPVDPLTAFHLRFPALR